MDLGIQGRRALLTASSRGLGKACAVALAREGVHVTINGLDRGHLDAAAAEIEALGVEVNGVAADINTSEGRAALLAACPDPDILVNNNWGPPPGDWLSFEYEDWLRAVEANMLAPIMMIKAVVPAMRERRFGRIVNITSQMVKSPFSVMGLSAGARAGLTAACKALSRDVAADNITINNLLPERIDTERQVYMAQRRAASAGMSYEDARAEMVESIAAKRMGRPEEFGAMCAYLCSVHTGYISGQNIQLDGGSYRGTI
ncbi:MAG: SDR family oxidoreductase [Acidimicrobiia bacterium]|nr:SDR family oxidoreductase [Acidimicrobiia bacterium]MDH4305913.1 SDR family oxidoreductase [Acidimicrobiia bacterium]MDH5293025.1 SDR family oxidoreductase [Acidimicrobiia bacterium]